ncbi:hypothetical protein GCM10023231_02360 [Olivibacter ginsenosidimutans]|uniref:Uncharacterized protein n=1 Tax=Olivibacter ginsenosidimutans TaxID=1176537 RepID=A0ABP9AEI0_9SPHI
MEHLLSVDLLRRLKLHGYTALIPKGVRGDTPVYTITNYPIEDLGNNIPGAPVYEGDFTAIEDLLLHENDLELKGVVILPDEDLSSAL